MWGHRDRAAIGDRLIAGVDDGDGGEAVVAGDGGGAPLVNGGDELDVFGEVGVPVEVGPRDDGGLAQFFVAGADDGGAGLKRANGDQAVGADDLDPRVVRVLDTLGAGDGPLGAGVKAGAEQNLVVEIGEFREGFGRAVVTGQGVHLGDFSAGEPAQGVDVMTADFGERAVALA